MRTSISAIAAMIAAASFAGSALAEGDYYEGVSKTQISERAENANVDTVRTASIEQSRVDSQRNDQTIFPRTSRDNR